MTVRVSQAALQDAVRNSGRLPQTLRPLAAASTRECKTIANERTERHTGQLEGGYTSEVRVVGGGPVLARIHTENRVKHAIWMEDGTKPHRIPKNGETILSWVKNGRRITIRGHVQHPGTKAYHIIRDALARVVLRRGLS